METVMSYERMTGMGARHETQVLADGVWYPVSQYPTAQHVRRENGFEVWTLEAPGVLPSDVRAYHRSNSGGETMTVGFECHGYQGEDVPVQVGTSA